MPLAKVLPFVELVDHRPGKALDGEALRLRFAPTAAPRQASLFDAVGHAGAALPAAR